MKIAGWSVDGFGHFRDYEVDDLPDGLVVLYGENEAGKSTLLAFMRGVLFGFPSRRGSEPQYEPVKGGRHGGRIFLQAEDGLWVVDRENGRRRVSVTSPAGPAGEEDLSRLLGGADATVFKNIFAFGLSELQELNSLSSDAVRSRIFAAGLVGAGRSAREVVKTLSDEAGALFTTPQAWTKAIPRLQKEIRDRDAELRAARAELSKHAEMVREEERSAAEEKTLAVRINELRRKEARLSLQLDVWPAWNERELLAARLAELDTVESFPADGDARLERALAEQKTARDREHQASAEWQTLVRDRRALLRTLNVRLRDTAQEVTRCSEQLALHRVRLGEANTAEAELRGAEQQLADKLRDLDPEWSEARLAAFDTSILRQAEIREWERRLGAAEVEVRDAARESQSAAHYRQEAQSERDRLAADVLKLPTVDPSRLAADEAALGRLRANLGELRASEAKREAEERIAEEKRRVLNEVHAAAEPAWIPFSKWAAILAAIVLVGACALAVLGSYAAAAVAGVMAIVFGVAATTLRAAAHRSSGAQTGAEAQRQKRKADLAAEEQALEGVRREEARLRAAVEQDANSLGLALPFTGADVEARARRAAEDRELLARRTNAVKLLEASEGALARASVHAERQSDLLRQTEAQLAHEKAAWARLKTEATLPGALAPVAALDFLREIQEGRDRLRSRDEIRDKLERLRGQINAWESDALSLIRPAGFSFTGRGEALAATLQQLSAISAADVKAREHGLSYRREQRKKKEEVRTARRAVEQAASSLTSLFAEGQALDETDFRRRKAVFDEISSVQGKLRSLDKQITERLGSDVHAQTIREELATGHLQEWRDKQSSIADEVHALEAARDDALRRTTALATERKALERSADIPRLETEIEVLRTELATASRRWAVITLAKSLVEDTLGRYMKERQPGVLRTAGRNFSNLTEGRYTEVMQEHGESFVVLDESGRTKRPEQLSRGTAEQLYLSLRLALAEEFAQHGAALPLVMDDVLVNFDTRRAHATAAALSEIGEQRQVLVFTCHRSTARLLRRHGAEVLPVGVAGW